MFVSFFFFIKSTVEIIMEIIFKFSYSRWDFSKIIKIIKAELRIGRRTEFHRCSIFIFNIFFANNFLNMNNLQQIGKFPIILKLDRETAEFFVFK